MRCLLLAALAIGATAWAQDEMPKSVAEQLVDSIQRGGYRRVGVLPRFLARQQGGRETIAGPLGPQADYMAEQLEERLADAAQGRFRIVDGRQMREAFKSLAVDDLGRPDALRKAAAAVGGLDALAVCSVNDLRGTPQAETDGALSIRARLVDLRDGSLAGSSKEATWISLSDAAYMGESWELRRWVGNRLTNVAFAQQNAMMGSEPNAVFGRGPLYEKMQYADLRPGLPHPLSTDDCPLRLAIAVGGRPRPPVAVGKKLYVPIEPGEKYVVQAENRLSRPVYLIALVDGVNVLGKRRQHPAAAAYWFLKPHYTSNLRGWYTGAQGSYTVEEFVVTAGDDSVAAAEGFGAQLGMITAVFLTVGMDGIAEPPMIAAAEFPGSFGTGSGRSSHTELEETSGPEPGLILAAMTLHYGPKSMMNRK